MQMTLNLFLVIFPRTSLHFKLVVQYREYEYDLFMLHLDIRQRLTETVTIFVHPDIIDQVRKRLIPVFRPDLPSEIGDNKGIIQLMQMCWDDEPSMRPTFSEIKSKLKSLSRGK